MAHLHQSADHTTKPARPAHIIPTPFDYLCFLVRRPAKPGAAQKRNFRGGEATPNPHHNPSDQPDLVLYSGGGLACAAARLVKKRYSPVKNYFRTTAGRRCMLALQ
ncbi:hypothetical protein [Kouleothrix sp.]|uniref:hypothetical protein n=1 Tax=Kouleothrix sp. TaxID=2779161 RepID=UPI00391B174F